MRDELIRHINVMFDYEITKKGKKKSKNDFKKKFTQ